ncbi:MAG: hypothetical protein RJA70_4238 [Pseudomonadota bacterium]|jgi:hypothetical protein
MQIETLRLIRTSLGCILLSGMGIACEPNRECERERMALARSFEQVQLTAAKAKVLSEERAKSMDTDAKKDHVGRWSLLENKAGLLHSAVMTEQVTWNSAEDALKESRAKFESATPSSPFEQGFGVALAQAQVAFENFRSKCR